MRLTGTKQWLLLIMASAIAAIVVADVASAQNSLGLGSSEQAIKPEGLFGPFLMWVKAQQQTFYTAMRLQLQAMRNDGSHVWLLIGMSFVYGIFHAIGPGHGKAVISSYMIANEVAARRGIILSFASSGVQAISAIVVVAIFALVLRGMGLKQSDATQWLEIASYAAVTLLGAWLLWSKIFGGGHHGHDHGGHGAHNHHDHAHGHHHDDGHDHMHAPDPKMLKGSFGLRQAWSAILAVGLRPCSGALIVLTFAFLNGLILAGVASTFAMAAGTGITVAALAALAVWAKDLAIEVGQLNDRATVIHRGIEIAGAAFVFLIGLTLLSASLYG